MEKLRYYAEAFEQTLRAVVRNDGGHTHIVL
jgi:hypothetical protein